MVYIYYCYLFVRIYNNIGIIRDCEGIIDTPVYNAFKNYIAYYMYRLAVHIFLSRFIQYILWAYDFYIH